MDAQGLGVTEPWLQPSRTEASFIHQGFMTEGRIPEQSPLITPDQATGDKKGCGKGPRDPGVPEPEKPQTSNPVP